MIHSSFNPQHQAAHVESKIVVALEKISEAFRVLLWQKSRTNGLSPLQIQLLVYILYHVPETCTISSLAAEFNMSKATLSDSVKLLLQKNLLKKEDEPGDTRSFRLLLSAEGKRIATESASFAGIMEKAITNFTPDNKDILLAGLLKIIEELNKEGVITVQRMCSGCHFYNTSKSTHYCDLMNKALQGHELRIDCPEHQTASQAL